MNILWRDTEPQDAVANHFSSLVKNALTNCDATLADSSGQVEILNLGTGGVSNNELQSDKTRIVIAHSPTTLPVLAQTHGTLVFTSQRLAHIAQQKLGLRGFFLPFPANPSSSKHNSRILFTGSPEIEHRAHKVFLALRAFNYLEVEWLIDAEEEKNASQLLARFDWVKCRLHRSRTPDAWTALTSEGGLCLHLLSSGEAVLEPYLPLSLLSACSVVSLDNAASEFYSDSLVKKIPCGLQEVHALQSAIDCYVRGRRNQVQQELLEQHHPLMVANALLQIAEFSLRQGLSRTLKAHVSQLS